MKKHKNDESAQNSTISPARRMNHLEEVSQTTQQEYSNMGTDRIQSKRAILHLLCRQFEEEIATHTASLNTAKEQRDNIQAQIRGLNAILEKR